MANLLSFLTGNMSDDDAKKLLDSGVAPTDVSKPSDSQGFTNPSFVGGSPGEDPYKTDFQLRQEKKQALLDHFRDPEIVKRLQDRLGGSILDKIVGGIANVAQYTPRGGHIARTALGQIQRGNAEAEADLANFVGQGDKLESSMRADQEQNIKQQEENRAAQKFGEEHEGSSLTPAAQVHQYILNKYNPDLAQLGSQLGESQIGKLIPEIEKQQDVQTRQEEAKARLAETQQQHAQAFAQRQQEIEDRRGKAGEVQDQKTRKDLNDMFDQMNPTGRGGILNRDLIQRQQAAERLQALALGTGGDVRNLTKQQMVELARSLDSVITGSKGTATEGMTKALVPESAVGNLQNMIQYLTNAPKGTNQQAFIQNMLDTAEREKSLATEQLKERMAQTASKYSYLKNKGPEAESDYNKNLKTLGFDPEKDFDDNGRYIRQGIGKAVQNAPNQSSQNSMVDVVLPNGKPGRIPATKLDSLIKAGGKQR